MNYYCPNCGQTVTKDEADCPRCLKVFDSDAYPLRRPESGLFYFAGRIGRLNYFLVILLGSITGSVLGALISGMPVLLIGLLLPFLWISIASGIKRCHDLNKSGWWMALGVIPIINIGLAIYLHFFKGTEGINNYGPSPDGYGQPPAEPEGAAILPT